MQAQIFRTVVILSSLSFCAIFAHSTATAQVKANQPTRSERLKEREEQIKLCIQLNRQGKLAEAIIAGEKVAALDRELFGEGTVGSFDSTQFLARLYWNAGRLEDAERLFREAGAAWEKLHKETPHIYVMNLVYLGQLQMEMGQLELAESRLRLAYQIEVKLGKRDAVYAESARALAQLCMRTGELGRAEELFKTAHGIRLETVGKKHIDYAQGLHDLAVVCLATGRSAVARELLDEALPIFEANGGQIRRSYATILTTRAHVASQLKDLEEARRLYLRALEIRKALGGENSPETADSLVYLGQLTCRQGKYAEAEEFLERALAILGNHPDKLEKSSIIFGNLANINAVAGKLPAALRFEVQVFESQQKVIEQVFSISTESGMYEYLESINGRMPRLLSLVLLQQATNPTAASTALTWVLRRKGIVVETTCQFRERERLVLTDPTVRQDAHLQQRVELLERSREELAELMTNSTTEIDADFEERKKKLERLIDSRERQVHQALSVYFGKQIQPFQTVGIDKVRGGLPKDSVLVEFIRSNGYEFNAIGDKERWLPAHYLAFVVSADPLTPVRLVDLGPAEEIDQLVHDFRKSIQQAPRDLRAADEKTVEEDFRPVARQLYQQVFAPLQPFIGKTPMIYLAPDSELNRIPFEALVDKQEKYLVESYRFDYLVTGRDLLRPPATAIIGSSTSSGSLGTRTKAAPQGTVVFAGPDFDLKTDQRKKKTAEATEQPSEETSRGRGTPLSETRSLHWHALPGAAAESEDLQRSLQSSRYRPVRVYLGAQAMEEVFKAMQPPRVLHIATHGFFLPDQEPNANLEQEMPLAGVPSSGGLSRLRKMENPLRRSGLVLAGANSADRNSGNYRIDDGYLTAEEISLKNLRGTDLVVLSACETGLGDIRTGQGVYGLRHAFLYAGARSLVTSLFEVPDAETRDLMSRFYESLVTGQSKLNSLHDAQLKMIEDRRKKNDAAHPFFWASFVLIGDPN